MINLETVELYCGGDITKIENYDKAVADTTQTWCCHHRGEILPCGRYTRKTLNKYGLYFNRPPEELIFVPRGEHQKMHHQFQKRPPRSEQWRIRQSESHKGQKAWNKGLTGKDNPQTGAKRNEASRRNIRASKIGYTWWNNGNEERQIRGNPPKGWKRGRLKWTT